jgi:GT2 family glycosyltransferase
MPKPTISVVICAYTERRWDDLIAALDSLRRQTHPPDDIIVVIDHNPTLYQRVAAAETGITLLHNQYTQGLSGARNTGLAHATGEVIAFMDEDAWAEPDWVETLLNTYQDPDVIGVGGQIQPQWQSGKPAWFPPEFDWVVGCTYLGMPTTPQSVRNLIGCNMSFRRAVFAEVGTFRLDVGRVGTLPLGCEETELCIRVRQQKPHQRLMYDPRAVVKHRVPAARANWGYFRSRCYSEGLSKAQISQTIGANDALSTERGYTLKVLPMGVLRGLGDALRGDLSGLGRASAIVLGFSLTALGYLVGRIRTPRAAVPVPAAP